MRTHYCSAAVSFFNRDLKQSFRTRFPTRYICVHSQCVADEGHAGAGGGVDHGVHAGRWQRTLFFCSSFGKLAFVGAGLPDLLPVCKGQ